MRAVMPVALPEVLHRRKRTGADRFDEMWGGELHMSPSPSARHQGMVYEITAFFNELWALASGGKAFMQLNVSTPERWDDDYRIPDVAVVASERLKSVDDAPYAQPVLVIEVRSPDDESYDKLPFYAAIGVEAVVVVERDSKASQIFHRAGSSFFQVAPGPDGWTRVLPLEVEARSEAGEGGARFRLRLAGRPDTERSI